MQGAFLFISLVFISLCSEMPQLCLISGTILSHLVCTPLAGIWYFRQREQSVYPVYKPFLRLLHC